MDKMNWGWKIAITYTLFALMTLAFVVIGSMKKVNLVEEDYYEKEIKYQDQIDKMKNSQLLGDHFHIDYQPKNYLITLQCKVDEPVMGNILLFRPSNSDRDLNIPINLDGMGKQIIDVSTLLKGLWVVKVSWESGGKSFYNSQQIHIQ